MTDMERIAAFQAELQDLMNKYGVVLQAVLTPQTTNVQNNEMTVKFVPEIQVQALPIAPQVPKRDYTYEVVPAVLEQETDT